MTQEEAKRLIEQIRASVSAEDKDVLPAENAAAADGAVRLSSLLSTGSNISVTDLSEYLSCTSYSESGSMQYSGAFLGYLWSNLFYVRICVDYEKLLKDRKIEVSDVKSLTLHISIFSSGMEYPVYLYKSDSTYIGQIDLSTSSFDLPLETTTRGKIEVYVFPDNKESGMGSVELWGSSFVYTDPLSEIRITTPPTKTKYIYGEQFNTAGMVVRAYKNDGTSKVITDYTYAPTGALTQNDTTITIFYGTKSVTQAISVIIAPIDKKITVHYSGTSNHSIVFENAAFPPTRIKK